MSSAIRNFIVTLLVSLLIFTAISYTIINNVSEIFPDISTPVTEASEDETDDELITESSEIEDSTAKPATDDSFTALLIGTDYQPNILNDYDVSAMNAENDGFPIKARQVSCDAIMIVRADRQKQTYMFSSIPSQLEVTVDGATVALGRVYALKGLDYFISAVYAATGLDFDYYALINIDGLEKVIDTIGGVRYTVPVSMSYIDEAQNLDIDIVSGEQLLDGKKALDMLRYVSYVDGDISRRKLAVDFAKAMFKQMTSAENAANIAGIYSSICDAVSTNFTIVNFTQHLEIILDYPTFTSTELTYPCSLTSEGLYAGDLDKAISLYKDYR